VITALLIVAIAAVRLVVGNAPKRKTWDCGYAVPTPRMQYTSSSFARTLVAFFRWVMPAVVNAPRRFSLFPLHARSRPHAVAQAGKALDRLRALHPERTRAALPSLRGRNAGDAPGLEFAMIVINLLLVLVFAPLLPGVINKTKALAAGRVGPPVLQAYFDISKLLRKGSVLSETTTPVFLIGPAGAVVASRPWSANSSRHAASTAARTIGSSGPAQPAITALMATFSTVACPL